MKIFMNFRKALWLSGGANSFLSGLRAHLEQDGFTFTNNIEDNFDLAFLNALTDGLTLEQVKRIHARGKPIIHRKVGYVVSGSKEMRAVHNGIVHGDQLQIDFSPYVSHTVFQSNYSRDVFLTSGFTGNYTVIPNGVNTETFNTTETIWPFGFGRIKPRKNWDGHSTFRLAIVSWSKDKNKGFDDYLQFDEALNHLKNVEIWFIGRHPSSVHFKNIKTFSARGHRRLASLLKQCHGFIQMARCETCSNALIEAINCGLPPIYLDSGSNREIACNYGIEYQNAPVQAIETLQRQYNTLIENIRSNPFTMDRAAQDYITLIKNVTATSAQNT
jgi:glycosyltransferase involved in cell wall biosynthesis